MPIALEPNQSFPIVLDCDQDKPAESRPTFFAKSQSMRGQKKLLEVLDRLSDDKDATVDDLFNDAINALGDVLTGWKHMNGIDFTKDALIDLLTYTEARELIRKVSYNQHLTPEEKKS
jgi:hypothetical protein